MNGEARLATKRVFDMTISQPLIYMENLFRGTLRDPGQLFRARSRWECPICNFKGHFLTSNRRIESRCPNCSSKERDRIFQLYLTRAGIDVTGKRILHFSPERPFWRKWRHLPGYVSGDVKKNKVANTAIDVTHIQFEDETFDLLVCHHVLEHVPDDARGMRECYRVLKKGGTAFFSVPLDETRDVTFTPPETMPREEVDRICGWDHKRIYGRDFADKLRAAGFDVAPVAYTDEEAQRFRLLSDLKQDQDFNKVFVAKK